MSSETKLPSSSLDGDSCRQGGSFLFCGWGGIFLFLPKSHSLGQWRWFVDCWPLLLPLASFLSVKSLLLFCWWCSASLSISVGEMFSVLGCPECSVRQNYPLRPWTGLVAVNFLFCRCGGNFLFLLKSHVLGQWCWFVDRSFFWPLSCL